MKVLAFCLFFIQATFACKFPTSMLCDHPEITKQCNAETICASTSDKVKITLYFESLCPDCKATFASQVMPAYNAVKDIADFELVPFGNAEEKLDPNTGLYNFTCQHGPDECEGNLLETCAIHILAEQSRYVPFIGCMEASKEKPNQAAKDCAKSQGHIWDGIWHCTRSSNGNKLQHAMAQKTEALNPPHTYVPWFTLNGVHTDQIQNAAEDNLIALICSSYKGTNKPAACSHSTPIFPPKGCYRDGYPIMKWIRILEAKPKSDNL